MFYRASRIPSRTTSIHLFRYNPDVARRFPVRTVSQSIRLLFHRYSRRWRTDITDTVQGSWHCKKGWEIWWIRPFSWGKCECEFCKTYWWLHPLTTLKDRKRGIQNSLQKCQPHHGLYRLWQMPPLGQSANNGTGDCTQSLVWARWESFRVCPLPSCQRQRCAYQWLSPRTNVNLLQRSEVVALINTLFRLSESLSAVEEFRRMWRALDEPSSQRIVSEIEDTTSAQVCFIWTCPISMSWMPP